MYVGSRVLRRQIYERLASCMSRRYLNHGPSRAITSKIFEKYHNNHPQQNLLRRLPIQPITGQFSYRFYGKKSPPAFDGKSRSSTAQNDDDDDWSDKDWSSDDEYFEDKNEKTDLAVPNAVPEIFPKVPLIAVKYPIFPKFSKILEVSDPKLIKRLEWCVGNYTPYAGVFVLKDFESETANVTDINQVHPVGTFIKIGEMERRGNKLHLIATGHRRIKIIRPIDRLTVHPSDTEARKENDDNVEKKPIESASPEPAKAIEKETVRERVRERVRDKVKDKGDYVNVKRAPTPPPTPPPTEDPDAESKDNGPTYIHMVETENMTSSEVDTQSTEYKAITLEIVSTVRQIITENPFIQEAVKQMLGENLNVAENPAYLADLAAAITSARPAELQQIMEEEDVIYRNLVNAISHLKLISNFVSSPRADNKKDALIIGIGQKGNGSVEFTTQIGC